MTTQHLDELARLLGGESATRSSSQLPSLRDGLTVTVAGYGRLELPLTAARTKKLLTFGEPAPFGKGEQTLVDTAVRHTWHFPQADVTVDWHDNLDAVLEDARSALDLPTSCRLQAQFHSLLVYERGQFFAPHQDSEKDDAMVATLVVVLPCPFTGGELVVHGKEGPRSYPGSRTETTAVVLYADTVHEVLPIRTGHRVALTYNLLLRGDTSRHSVRRDAAADAESLLTRHFTTAQAPRFGGTPRTPARLAYLLDHSYTPRALAQGIGRLKGVDAQRAALLAQAAQGAGCEVVLALADVHETRNDDRYGDEEDLIDSDVTITHWLTSAGAVAEVDLPLGGDEVVATTPSRSLRAYATEHEGYMGNYGNTVDRWYHRGALLIWPARLALTNRVEAAPADELRNLLLRLADHDDAVTRDVRGILPSWPSVVSAARYRGRSTRSPSRKRGQEPTETSSMFALALALTVGLDDDAGDALIAAFMIEDLRPEAADSLVRLVDARGAAWTTARIASWFSPAANRGHMALSERWVEDLPALCRALALRPTLAGQLLEHTWSWLRAQIQPCLAATGTSFVRRRLMTLGALLASVLGGAAEAADGEGADAIREEIIAWCRDAARESIVDLLVPALHAAGSWDNERKQRSGMRDLAGLATSVLAERADAPPRDRDDWSLTPPTGCDCELCAKLADFLADRDARVLEWPIAKPKRQHIHSVIDAAELPITHTTRRVGSPHVLVLTKTSEVFERETRARAEAARDRRLIEKAWDLA